MALTYDDVTAITNKWYSKMFPQIVFDENIVMSRLWKGGSKVEGGERIMVPIKHAYGKAGSYGPYTVFDTSGEKNITSAEFLWKAYHGDITIDGFELIKNDNPLGIKKILDARMEVAKIGMADAMATDMWSKTNTDSSLGLTSLYVMCDTAAAAMATAQAAAPATATTTYGGIDRTTNTWWAGLAHVAPLGSGTLLGSTHMLTDCITNAVQLIGDGNRHPTLICAHPTVVGKFMSEGNAIQRVYGEKDLAMGWLVAYYSNIPFVGDRHLPTYSATAALNQIMFLDENTIDFVSHKDRNFIFKPMAAPVDQDVMIGRFLWAGNVTCSDPGRNGAMYTFTWAAA